MSKNFQYSYKRLVSFTNKPILFLCNLCFLNSLFKMRHTVIKFNPALITSIFKSNIRVTRDLHQFPSSIAIVQVNQRSRKAEFFPTRHLPLTLHGYRATLFLPQEYMYIAVCVQMRYFRSPNSPREWVPRYYTFTWVSR